MMVANEEEVTELSENSGAVYIVMLTRSKVFNSYLQRLPRITH